MWGLAILCLAFITMPCFAEKNRRGKNAEGAEQAESAQEHDKKIIPSGLSPRFPVQVRCPDIASSFASRTRYDGSYRPRMEFGGFHGGIDISLEIGTPLLALANATVVSKGAGGQMEGNYLWLRVAPQDAGLSYWVYAKYQHLDVLPDLEPGMQVQVGQVIGRSGKTGTTGGHYGAWGYPHLHLTTVKSAQGDMDVGARGAAKGGSLFDVLEIYRDSGAALAQDGSVSVPYVGSDGLRTPADAKTVWPVSCVRLNN